MIALQCVPKRSEKTASRLVDGEAVVVSPAQGIVRILNDVGSRVWELMDGSLSALDISEIIAAEFHALRDEVEKDVAEFLYELAEKGMVVLRDEPDQR
jgi:hypothetical protein